MALKKKEIIKKINAISLNANGISLSEYLTSDSNLSDKDVLLLKIISKIDDNLLDFIEIRSYEDTDYVSKESLFNILKRL